jgi:5'-nucleotidase
MLLVSIITPFSLATAVENEEVNITIVHTNDTHGRVEEGKYAGMGFAKIATKIKELREANENVLVLDAGDTLHGQIIAQLSEGESIIKIMNAMGYDAMVPGNHDFNYGQERLLELSEMADFPIISANILKEDGSKLLTPYIIKELDGVKIGIFGLSTPETTYKTHPNNVEGLTFNNPVETAKEMVAELEDKTDIIIALSHLGLDQSSEYTSEKIANEVEGIDLIVDGHSHTSLSEGKLIGNTLIVQTGEYDKNLGIVNIKYTNGQITEMTASLFTKEEAAELSEDEELLAVVSEVKAENEKITSVVVGSTDIKLVGEREKVRTGETNLGNLIAEAMLKVTGADIALTNGGGIRASIEPGEITRGDIITVLPFGNYVVVKEVKGSDILAALELGISAYPETLGAFPHVAGITFKFNPEKESGSRLIEVKVNGEPLDPNKTYQLATNDFLAAGGDNYVMLADDKVVGEFAGLDEVLAEHIKVYGVADAKVDGRIQVYTPEPEPTVETYIVKPGDVLWKIAKKFNLQWEFLAKFNKMKNPHLIFPGQKILIPVQ